MLCCVSSVQTDYAMKKKILLSLLLLLAAVAAHAAGTARRVLFIGDSMTGWLSERLEAYGTLNAFEVSTVIWDGSTAPKWAKTGKLPVFIRTYKPDVVLICLGLNDMLAKNISARMASPLADLENQLGDLPFVWIGPPSWPGRSDARSFNDWMASHIDSRGRYFISSALQLARQSSSNPHPTRAACARWMDDVVKWLPSAGVGFPAEMKAPAAGEMKRGKVYIYRRMKQAL